MVALLLVAGERAGAQEGACEPPYSPVAVVSGYPANEFVDELQGPAVDVVTLAPTKVLNAAGTARVEGVAPEEELVVTRPSGELRLTAGGTALVGFSGGDLDGDGESEVWALEAVDGGDAFVVPSSTPSGTSDVATVGIRVQGGFPLLDDGFTGPDTILVAEGGPGFDYSGTTRVVDGAAVIAVAPGGDATGIAPLAQYGGVPVAVVDFASPQLLIAEAVGGPEVTAMLLHSVAVDGEVTELTTSPEPFWSAGTSLVGGILGVEGDGGPFLQMAQTSRSPVSYVWSYGAPCTALTVRTPEAVSEPPPAPTSVAAAGATPLRFAG